MTAPILEQGRLLIVSLRADATDNELQQLGDDLAEQIGHRAARGVVFDVSEMQILDSYATRMLETLANVAALRGAQAVVAGIQPDVALAMVQLGVTLASVEIARDLEDAVRRLSSDDADVH